MAVIKTKCYDAHTAKQQGPTPLEGAVQRVLLVQLVLLRLLLQLLQLSNTINAILRKLLPSGLLIREQRKLSGGMRYAGKRSPGFTCFVAAAMSAVGSYAIDGTAAWKAS